MDGQQKHDGYVLKSCNCNKKSCDFLLVLMVTRLGNPCDLVFEESCNEIQLLANKLQMDIEGCVSAEVYSRIRK